MPSSAYTATSEIYTLSLHDALPIFAGAPAAGQIPGRPARPSARMTVLSLASVAAGLALLAADLAAPAGLRHSGFSFRGEYFRAFSGDRKSTRLNSSHGYISYAVFCLYRHLRDLHSFPTRRSSDLRGRTGRRADSRAAGTAVGAHDRVIACVGRGGPCASCCRSCGAGGASTFRVLLSGRILSCFFGRSEEHTSELQSRLHLVCRLLLIPPPPRSTLFPYTTLFRSSRAHRPPGRFPGGRHGRRRA